MPNTKITIPSINIRYPLDGLSLIFKHIIIRTMAITGYRIIVINWYGGDIMSGIMLIMSKIAAKINKILIIKSFLSSSMFTTLFFVFTFVVKKKI